MRKLKKVRENELWFSGVFFLPESFWLGNVWLILNKRYYHTKMKKFLDVGISKRHRSPLEEILSWLDFKFWNPSWFYYVFWVFSYIIDEHSCLKYCISIKLSQIVCLINWHIMIMSTCQICLKIVHFFCVFLEFSNITTCWKRYNFIKLLQIVS